MELAVSGTPQHATKMDKCNFHETNADDSSCSSSSTISCPAEMAETGCHGQTLSNKNSSNSLQMRQRNRLIFFWSNFVLIITLVIGILICLAAYFCLGNTEVLEEKTNGHINKGNVSVRECLQSSSYQNCLIAQISSLSLPVFSIFLKPACPRLYHGEWACVPQRCNSDTVLHLLHPAYRGSRYLRISSSEIECYAKSALPFECR